MMIEVIRYTTHNGISWNEHDATYTEESGGPSADSAIPVASIDIR